MLERRIRTCRITVNVSYSEGWRAFIKRVGAKTEPEHRVWRDGLRYASNERVAEVNITLLNFSNKPGSWDEALRWAKTNDLQQTTPRESFACGDSNDLFRILDCYTINLIETTGIKFRGFSRACCLHINKVRRAVDSYTCTYFGDKLDWFAFKE